MCCDPSHFVNDRQKIVRRCGSIRLQGRTWSSNMARWPIQIPCSWESQQSPGSEYTCESCEYKWVLRRLKFLISKLACFPVIRHVLASTCWHQQATHLGAAPCIASTYSSVEAQQNASRASSSEWGTPRTLSKYIQISLWRIAICYDVALTRFL